MVGAKVWDHQHKFRIRLGPLSLQRYESFLPGGAAIGKLVAWVRQYLCFELEWDVRVSLRSGEVENAELKLGKYGRLGWTTWLGNQRPGQDPADLILDCERLLAERGAPAQLGAQPA